MLVTRHRYWFISGLLICLAILGWQYKLKTGRNTDPIVENKTVVKQAAIETKPLVLASSEPIPMQEISKPVQVQLDDEYTFPIDKLQQFIPDIKDGKLDLKYADGQKKIQGILRDGKPIGIWRNWYPNGHIALEMSWLNGQPNGKTKSWYSNGNRRGEIFFVNGKAEGRWQRWFPNGQIKQDIAVRKGVVQTMTRWDDQGHLIADIAVHDSKISGVVLSWYQSGAKKSESVFKKNELVRKTEWDEDGNIVDLNDN